MSGLPLVGQLLVHAATGTALGAEGSVFDSVPSLEQDRQFEWVMQAGLGPLLLRAANGRLDAVPPRFRDRLLAADLTARARHPALVDTTLDVIDVCSSLSVPVTLLKGISTSEQLYPAEHLRPMNDVDVLVPEAALDRVEAALVGSGYEKLPEAMPAGLQHGPPLRHRRLGAVVELHMRLFSLGSPLTGGSAFRVSSVTSRSVPSHYHGRLVHRLAPALQLAYIAAYWFDDLARLKVQPSYIPAMLDAVYLLRAFGASLDWNGLQGWLDNPLARGSLYALLSYLPRFGVCSAPPEVMDRLSRNQGSVGPLQRRAIHWMLDRYLVGARPWTLFFPPPMPGRYSPGRQFRKRVLRQRA